jgi:hypothetical protein
VPVIGIVENTLMDIATESNISESKPLGGMVKYTISNFLERPVIRDFVHGASA